METTLTNQLNLIRMYILKEFFRHFGIDVESRSFEIGDLLNRIMDKDIQPVAAIKAIRTFGQVPYSFRVDDHLPPAVMAAVKNGLDDAGVSWKQDGLVFNLNLKGNSLPIGLLEAKKMYDLLRSM